MCAGIGIRNSIAISTRTDIIINKAFRIRNRIAIRINLHMHTSVAIQHGYSH